MSRIAIIAGQGALAPAVAACLDDPLVFALPGFAPDGLTATTFQSKAGFSPRGRLGS